jgi:putative transposase
MKRIAEALGVSRSNLAERTRGVRPPRGPYLKAEDAVLLPIIRSFVDERPTYGYRRITALVNRQLAKTGHVPVNRKRVHRIMQRHALLLERHTGRREGRIHDGKVMDAFDREIIAWTAVCGAGISGSDVRDMMLEAVEKRFGTVRAPHSIEHLSDNGSPYTAKGTRDFAAALNLVPCFTPVKSPESNGMSEAFVKTFKRDYARVNPLPDAATALRQIAGWINDYNEIHPHSALKMRSPREFIRAQPQ